MGKKKILFINGPPRSGKDTAASILRSQFGGHVMKMTEPLDAAIPRLFGMTDDQWREIREGDVKEKSSPLLCGLSCRHVLQLVSEEWLKPKFGSDFLGWVMARRIEEHPLSFRAYVSDSGFTDEALPIIDKFGGENCMAIRLARQGCSFEGDTREYLDVPLLTSKGVRVVDIMNDDSIHKFQSDLISAVRSCPKWLRV